MPTFRKKGPGSPRGRECGVLVVDELGYLPMSREEANLFFRLVARSYKRASLIIASNKRLG